MKHSGEPDLDLKITILNINEGHNMELAAKSPTLHQYMIFVDSIRKYQEQMKFELAIEKAVDECIQNGIIADFLKRNRSEVLRMSIFEYDQEEHLRMEREESEAIGREIGRKEGIMEEKQETSLQLANMGLSLESIAKAVRVSMDTVAQWLSIEGISVDQ